MNLVILHDIDNEEILVNLDKLNAAVRKYPDESSVIKDPYTRLFYVQKDKGMEGFGFPDTVKETPVEIHDLAKKS